MTRFSVKPGDKIAYSVQFLRSCGLSHSAMAHWRGTVTEVRSLSRETHLAAIQWANANDDAPKQVNVQNLAKVGPNTRFAQS